MYENKSMDDLATETLVTQNTLGTLLKDTELLMTSF